MGVEGEQDRGGVHPAGGAHLGDPECALTVRSTECVSDLTQHYLLKAGSIAFCLLSQTNSNRVALATGVTIVSRPDELQEFETGRGSYLLWPV